MRHFWAGRPPPGHGGRVVLDADGVVRHLSPHNGYRDAMPEASVIGRHYSDLMLPSDAAKLSPLLACLRVGAQPLRTSYTLVAAGRAVARYATVARAADGCLYVTQTDRPVEEGRHAIHRT